MSGVNGEVGITGEMQGFSSQGITQLWLQAPSTNSGKVYIGFGSNAAAVTVPDGEDDSTSGFELAEGESIGPIRVSNLNRIQFIGTDADDSLVYFATTA